MYRAGGLVSWPSQVYSLTFTDCPKVIAGKRLSALSSSLFSSLTMSSYAAKKPAKVMTEPLARKIVALPSLVCASKSTRICNFLASAIWDATVRFQIKSYKANSSRESSGANSPGVLNVSPAGRIASCASCAFLVLPVYARGESATWSAPYKALAALRAASIACCERLTLSVRI